MRNSELINKALEYLKLCEERKLDEASRFLAPDVVLRFPGGVQYHDLNELVHNAKKRYEKVSKKVTTTSVGVIPSTGASVVSITGTLYGVDLKGKEFNDVRFSDTFTFNPTSLITEQSVFNDLAELGIVPSSSSAA